MRREPIIKYENDKFSIYGYEILADFPQLIVNEDIDFRTFKLNLDLLKEELKTSTTHYHLNLSGKTILKYKEEILKDLSKIENKEKVIIELLEDDAPEAEEILNFFLANNIKVSLDDFGTVSSNFDRLMKYKDVVESIKIDRILWVNMLNVVKEIVSFCNENSINVILEKVETKEELDELISMGGKLFQGWYFKENFLTKNALEKAEIRMDDSLLIEFFKKAVELSQNKQDLNDIIKTFEILAIAHSLNINFNSEEFLKLKEKFLKENIFNNQEACVVDKKLKQIIKILLAENQDYLRSLEESLKILRFYLTIDNNDMKVYNTLRKLIDKSTNFMAELKENLTEIEVLDLKTFESNDGEFLDKKKFEIDLRFYFNKYKKENKNFVTGLIYIESLMDILYNHGYSAYTKAFHKAINAIKGSIGENDVIAIIDNNTFGILYEGDNPLKLKKLKDRISNVEIRIDKVFEVLKARVCGTMPRRDDRNVEDLISRLYGLLYEIYSFKDKDFVFE
ncbi:EAL domain-containing protein [Sulfurihydrogenibium sp.]|uniref:EAL domain-containing protein n=1 Tax=Sulfurihydrogenibium sp. TaxID=2053621 RepID=UPI0026251FB7|nr:EAL domain-containing protein [Sulfurihydrogenibium sp.]